MLENIQCKATTFIIANPARCSFSGYKERQKSKSQNLVHEHSSGQLQQWFGGIIKQFSAHKTSFSSFRSVSFRQFSVLWNIWTVIGPVNMLVIIINEECMTLAPCRNQKQTRQSISSSPVAEFNCVHDKTGASVVATFKFEPLPHQNINCQELFSSDNAVSNGFY